MITPFVVTVLHHYEYNSSIARNRKYPYVNDRWVVITNVFMSCGYGWTLLHYSCIFDRKMHVNFTRETEMIVENASIQQSLKVLIIYTHLQTQICFVMFYYDSYLFMGIIFGNTRYKREVLCLFLLRNIHYNYKDN